ncbi:Tatdn3 [Symbiodinium sp. CCMP2592]|nr:Tatdn3 [Symbiodinium sp. CCMP2592]
MSEHRQRGLAALGELLDREHEPAQLGRFAQLCPRPSLLFVGPKKQLREAAKRPSALFCVRAKLETYRVRVAKADVRAGQISLFKAHLDLARELDLPVNVHSRNAEKEALDILARYDDVRGVMHAFKGPAALAVQATKTGRLWFSFPPSLVYKWEYQEAVKALPLERLLLETDSPSLAAAGPKARNEPGLIRAAAEKMAELQGVTLEEVAAVTTQNAVHLFGKASPGLQARTVPGTSGTSSGKAARWRRDAKDHVQIAADPPEPGHVPCDLSRQRWSRRSRGAQACTMDPTLCSSAFGPLHCD